MTRAKFICKTRDILQTSQDYLQYKSKSKFQYVRSNFQDILNKAFFLTPFDKFKVQRQIYFRRVQVQTNLLSDKFKEEFQDKVIDKLKVTKSKLLSTKKSIRFQIQDFFKISLFKTTIQIPLFKLLFIYFSNSI